MHIDSLSLGRVLSQQLWPILGHVIQPVFPVLKITGYCRMRKQLNVRAYFDELFPELGTILAERIQLQRVPTSVRVDLAGMVADTPAKALIKQIKYHSGYYSRPRYNL